MFDEWTRNIQHILGTLCNFGKLCNFGTLVAECSRCHQEFPFSNVSGSPGIRLESACSNESSSFQETLKRQSHLTNFWYVKWAGGFVKILVACLEEKMGVPVLLAPISSVKMNSVLEVKSGTDAKDYH